MYNKKSTRKAKLARVLFAGLLVAAAPGWADTYAAETYYEPADSDSSYSFARVVEGSATVLAAGGERESLESQQPILVGDRLWVPHRSRLEIVLADRSLLRFAGESEMTFDRIAYSADTYDRITALRLHQGEVQMVVPADVLGDALPQIEVPGATLYIHREGTFRITVGRGWTELVVRDGLAEMVTERGSLLVHRGELGWVEGDGRPRLDARAARTDDLELWGDRLTAEAAYEVPYVDPSLRYAAAPLAEHGGWVEVGGRWCWRPRVEVAWRPYYRGYWRTTPVGLTWVSYDPWGWVTHHYGSWDYAPAYGWVWYPGRVYAPARVHWYWGPRYVGWIPSGYYGHYYRHRHHGYGLHFGIYGWAGGAWSHFNHWTFALTLNFGHRHHDDRYRGGYSGDRRHRDHGYRRGVDLARERPELERGIITTDPRLPAKDSSQVFASLERQLTELRRGRSAPDVTDFVARKPLSANLAGAVLEKPAKPAVADGAGWATGGKPLPRQAVPGSRTAAAKPAVKPATREAVRPVTASKPSLRDTGRRTYDKPVDTAAGSRRPTLTDRGGKPAKPSSTSSDKPGVVRPTYRDQPAPRTSSPTYKPAPRVPAPRTTTPKPTYKPAPRTSTPKPTYQPTPRTSTPKPTYKPAPRTSTPRPTYKPAPRVSAPRTTTPRPTYKPAPRTSTPRPTYKPAPRTSTPRPTYQPAPRTSTPKPTYQPAPRVSTPRPTYKPAPRVSTPKPTYKPAPRTSSPSVSSRPAPRPAPRASSGSPSKPQVSKSPSRSSGKPQAKPSKGSSRRKDG